MVLTEFTNIFRIKSAHVRKIRETLVRFQSIPVGDRVIPLSQSFHHWFEEIRMAGHCDGRQEEDVVSRTSRSVITSNPQE